MRFAYGLTGDMSEAQDLTQEAYARAWQRWKRLQNYDNPESWLRLVVTRMATDRWRWLGLRRNAPAPVVANEPGPDPELLHLVAALKKLPLQQRKALVLHYFLDQPVAEIAAETGVNVNTVKTWLHRGRSALFKQLADTHFDQPDLSLIRRRAGQKRKRTLTATIIAFFATATAAAAAFLFVPSPAPPAVPPNLVLPYGADTKVGYVRVHDNRAFVFWQQVSGNVRISAFDLTSETLAWNPVDLGTFDRTFGLVGSGPNAVFAIGVRGDGTVADSVLLAIAPDSGKLLWQLPVNYTTNDSDSIEFFPDIVAVTGFASGVTEGRDIQTGQPKWTIAGTAKPLLAMPFEGELLQILADGTLRTVDPATGETFVRRTGVPIAKDRSGMVIADGWLYYLDAAGFRRISLSGNDPWQPIVLSQPLGSARTPLQTCGELICLVSDANELIVIDRKTGKELWRRHSDISVYDLTSYSAGIIVAGDDRDSASSKIFDYAGKDITPGNLTGWATRWMNDHTLVFRVRSSDITGPSEDGRVIAEAEMIIYDLATRRARSLGVIAINGNCDTSPTKLICPTSEGFTVYGNPH